MLKLITLLALVQPITIIWIRRLYVHGQQPPTPPPIGNESGPPPKFYNPNYGYEPYWPGGDWKNEDDPDATTENIPLVCGRECHYMYRPIKEVCGRDSWSTSWTGCWNYGGHGCKDRYVDQLHAYTTFDTYCQFLDYQCQSRLAGRYKRILNKWVFVHVGACVSPQELHFKQMFWYEAGIRSRLWFYMSSQADTFSALSKTPYT